MKLKGLRWWVITLIALATVINYIDRQALPVLWPDMAETLYPDKTADERKGIYALISTFFIFSYAFGQAIFGKIFDKVEQDLVLPCPLVSGRLPQLCTLLQKVWSAYPFSVRY